MRWGIAATGNIAASMCEALGTLPDAHVIAVGSRSQHAAEAFAARFGIPNAHGSYDALFADPDVDIVYVASPHSHHHAMTIAALDAGKHVLCEKAFATSLDRTGSQRATVYGMLGRIDVDAPFWSPSGFTVRLTGKEPIHVYMANQGLAHEAAHAMDRIRSGHRESDVIPLATTVSTMELLDDIRSQLGVVYPEEG